MKIKLTYTDVIITEGNKIFFTELATNHIILSLVLFILKINQSYKIATITNLNIINQISCHNVLVYVYTK